MVCRPSYPGAHPRHPDSFVGLTGSIPLNHRGRIRSSAWAPISWPWKTGVVSCYIPTIPNSRELLSVFISYIMLYPKWYIPTQVLYPNSRGKGFITFYNHGNCTAEGRRQTPGSCARADGGSGRAGWAIRPATGQREWFGSIWRFPEIGVPLDHPF